MKHALGRVLAGLAAIPGLYGAWAMWVVGMRADGDREIATIGLALALLLFALSVAGLSHALTNNQHENENRQERSR